MNKISYIMGFVFVCTLVSSQPCLAEMSNESGGRIIGAIVGAITAPVTTAGGTYETGRHVEDCVEAGEHMGRMMDEKEKSNPDAGR